MPKLGMRDLISFVNYKIDVICSQIGRGASIEDLRGKNPDLIFHERFNLYEPNRHPIEVYYTNGDQNIPVCKWEQFGDFPNDKQRKEIIRDIGFWKVAE